MASKSNVRLIGWNKGNMRLTAGTLLGGAATSIVGVLFFCTGILFTSVVNQMMFPMSVLSAMYPVGIPQGDTMRSDMADSEERPKGSQRTQKA